jgi:predicted solute-binding protein
MYPVASAGPIPICIALESASRAKWIPTLCVAAPRRKLTTKLVPTRPARTAIGERALT